MLFAPILPTIWVKQVMKKWNEWMNEISPGNELREWYNHDPSGWMEFKQLCKNELIQKQNEMKKIAIKGSGLVAKSLVTGLIRHGYQLILDLHDKSKCEQMQKVTEYFY
jgi:hypothetical protein